MPDNGFEDTALQKDTLLDPGSWARSCASSVITSEHVLRSKAMGRLASLADEAAGPIYVDIPLLGERQSL